MQNKKAEKDKKRINKKGETNKKMIKKLERLQTIRT
jgi:hypothetical protein